MKSTIFIALAAGAAVASPLRGNVMSPRFAEVGAGTLEAAYDACKADQLAKTVRERKKLSLSQLNNVVVVNFECITRFVVRRAALV
jgi:hypothetical protein